jgi:bidirectional [NiFe] hydrogenase diaphorase subunit
MTIRLRIDDIEVQAEPGEHLLDVARRAGFDIPALCDHEALEPIGACRICLVEVQNGDKIDLSTACNHLVEEGLRVRTDTPQVRKHRAMNLELMLARAPGSERIRQLAAACGVNRSRFAPLAFDPLPNCILCELCVRTCAQLGHNALTSVGRGDKKRIGLPFNRPSETCVGCASCASVCPTDCIRVVDTNATRAIWGQKFDFVNCGECGSPVITKAHRDHALASNELPEDYYDTCERCKQVAASKRFAAVVW